MNTSIRRLLAILGFTTLLAGCVSLPYKKPLPEGLSIASVWSISTQHAYAWSPDGKRIAYVDDSIKIYNLETSGTSSISLTPYAIEWTPDGKNLAAAFLNGKKSTLRVIDINGAVVSETDIDGHVVKLARQSPNKIYAAAAVIEKFSFGSNFRGVLNVWNGTKDKAESTLLIDSTMMPLTAKRASEELYRAFTIAFSPIGDEVVYSKLVDPPEFPSYLKIFVRNLESGVEKEVLNVKSTSVGLIYSADSETVFAGDGIQSIKRLDPWTGKENVSIPSTGKPSAISPSNRYLLINGTLYRDNVEFAVFPGISEGAFAPGGDRLLLVFENRLFLLSGLSETPLLKMTDQEIKQIVTLRKWRSQGLISDKEYISERKRIMAK